MAAKFSVSMLWAQSENLRATFTELSKFLSTLRLERSKQDGSSDTEDLDLLVELAEFTSTLFAATDMFYQRLHKFIERNTLGPGLTS
jgi:hypothetical protein